MFDYSFKEKYVLNSLWKKSQKYWDIPELKYCVRGAVLAPFQTMMVGFGLLNKKAILSADTGLGKTLVASGLVNVINQKKPNTKWILCGPCSVIYETAKKLSDFTYGLDIVVTDAKQSSIGRVLDKTSDDWDVLVLSYEAIVNHDIQDYLFNFRKHLTGIIIDESQEISNLSGNSSKMLKAMCKNMEYIFLLTATPIKVSVKQFINQIYLLDQNIVEDETNLSKIINYHTKYDESLKPVGVKHISELNRFIWDKYISVTRNEVNVEGNYTCKPIWCDDYMLVDSIKRKDIFKVLKGNPNGDAIKKLCELIIKLNSEGKKGLVYINLNSNKGMVKTYLSEHGINVDIHDGTYTPTRAKKEKVKDKFRSNEIQCLITNSTVGLDLLCDYIIFYELTYDYIQYKGRAERGIVPRDIELYFILCKYTEDVCYYRDNVHARIKLENEACGKHVRELDGIEMEIIKYLPESE